MTPDQDKELRRLIHQLEMSYSRMNGVGENKARKELFSHIDSLTQPPAQAELTDAEIAAHGVIASRMMAKDQTRFDAACEVMKYLRDQNAPYYYLHRMCTVLYGNTEGTEAARAADLTPANQPAAQAELAALKAELRLVAQNLEKGMSRSIQKLQARIIYGELEK